MPRIMFTKDEVSQHLRLPYDNLAIAINTDCDGVLCGARPDFQDEARSDAGPSPQHSHLVGTRNLPNARKHYERVHSENTFKGEWD